MDNTPKAQEAIRSLNPLCTLRYSATHKNPYNLVYSLNPIRAFDLRLVKQIVVASGTGEGAQNDAYVKLVSVDRKNGIKAKVEIDVQTNDGPKRKSVTVKNETDLFVASKERENYRDGYLITEINGEPGNEFVQFNSGKTLALGQELGGVRDDKVANYRSYDEQGQPVKGKFAQFFEEAFAEFSAQPKYKGLLPYPVEKLHNGYFAADKKGVF